MSKANEKSAQVMPEVQAVRDKRRFIKNLGWLLKQTKEGIASCEMLDISTVKVTYEDGTRSHVGISGDTYIEIARDVIGRMKEPNKINNALCNTGSNNSGGFNSGNYNSGDYNSGSNNSGNYNSGNNNLGDWNSGDDNTGDFNIGDFNSGDSNEGNFNTGNYNSGIFNTGDNNSGKYNSGDWNSGSHNTGCFNTIINPKIYLFNKPSDWTHEDWERSKACQLLRELPVKQIVYNPFPNMTDEEKASHPEAEVTGGILEIDDNSGWASKWWHELSDSQKSIIMAIPNFDKEIFMEITGIDVDKD